MKVAIVLTTRWWRASIDQDGYCAALARMGHQPSLYCLGNDAGEADFPVIEASADEMMEPTFWKEQGIDIAIVFNWLKGSRLLSALRAGGVSTVTRADSDGLASIRAFPAATLNSCLSSAKSPPAILREGIHWLRRYLVLGKEEDAELLATVEQSDSVAIESQAAADNLITILRHYGRNDLCSRVKVVPHSVKKDFLTFPINTAERSPMIFCGGRWNDVQKGAPLLVSTIERILATREDVSFVLAGSGMEAFQKLSPHPRVRLAGMLDRSELRTILANSRFLLSSSRWETQPIGSLEALCLGASVVAPALPGFLELADNGNSGTLSSHRTATGLLNAALTELTLWDQGRRDTVAIAEKWRARVNNQAVVEGLLDSLS